MKFLVLASLIAATTAFAAPVKYIKGSEAIENIYDRTLDTEIEGNGFNDDACTMYLEKNKVTKELTVGIKKKGRMTSLTIKPNDRIKTFNKSNDSAYSHEFYVLPNKGFISIFTKEDISDFDLEINPTGKKGASVECSWME